MLPQYLLLQYQPFFCFQFVFTVDLRSTTLYSLSKPDDALGGRNASLVCNLSHAYHFYDCAPPPRLPSYAGPPCAPGTTHDSFSQVCACGRRHTARVAHGLCLLYTSLYLRGDRQHRSPTYHLCSPLPCLSHHVDSCYLTTTSELRYIAHLAGLWFDDVATTQ